MQRDCNLDNFCNLLNIFGIKKWTQRTQDDKYLGEAFIAGYQLFVKSSIYEKEMRILKFIGNQDP